MVLLLGTWLFSGLLISGEWSPPLNPNLVMEFEFYKDGVSRLKYYRKDEEGTCERRALFEYDEQILVQKVTWLSKENGPRCAEDPDMQMGSETWTPVRIVENQMHMELQVGEETVILVWDKKSK